MPPCDPRSQHHLVNGMGQRIGTEGYGWIPRYYCSDKIGYVLGDASNAYGKVISPLWLERGKVSDVEYTPENGWDDVPLTKFRRHIVNLGKTGFIFIYDELEASEPADYTFMLHTTAQPMTVDTSNPRFVHVQGLSGRGAHRMLTSSLRNLADRYDKPVLCAAGQLAPCRR